MQSTLFALMVLMACQVSVSDRYDRSPTQPQPASEANPAGDNGQTPEAAAPVARPNRTTPQPTLDSEAYSASANAQQSAARSAFDAGDDPAADPSAPPADAPIQSSNASSVTTERADSLRHQYGVRPSELTELLYRRPADSELSGFALTLREALEGATSRSQQTRRTLAYWNCSAAAAGYYLALREMNDVRALASAVAQRSTEWQTTVDRIHTRTLAALQLAQARQQQLRNELRGADAAELPLPVDLPHSGNYDPRYDELFSHQSDSTAERLSESLPLQYETLKLEAKRAAEAYQWLDEASRRRSPQSDGTELLQAYELLALRRRVFIDQLHNYNRSIAAYAGIAAPNPRSADRVVAMLIRTSENATRTDSAVQQASAAETDGESASSAASEWQREGASFRNRFQARRPVFDILRGRQREHSILLNRRRRADD